MENKKLTQEEMEKRFQNLLKNNPYSLETYWDYRDEISEEYLMKVFNDEADLYEIIDDCEYVGNQVYELINSELSEEEQENDELFDYLRDRCYDEWNYNYDKLLSQSYVRLRIQLNSNEDYLDLENYKETDTYRYLKKIFKGTFKVKDFEKEMFEVCGSNYVNLTFMCEVNGLTLLEMKKQIQEKGIIKLTKGIKAGLFNDWLGAGSDFGLELPKNITLNVKDWTKDNQNYYEVSIIGDNISRYGINETYGFVGEMWQEMSY